MSALKVMGLFGLMGLLWTAACGGKHKSGSDDAGQCMDPTGKAAGEACAANGDCNSNLCDKGKCLCALVDEGCGTGGHCCSGTCDSASCSCTCSPIGKPCSAAPDSCCAGLECSNSYAGLSGVLTIGACCSPPKSTCHATADCCPGSTCSGGKCSCIAAAMNCSVDTDCCSGSCDVLGAICK